MTIQIDTREKPKPYLITVSREQGVCVREGAGTNYKSKMVLPNGGAYTIIAEADGKGAKKWGKLKSGAGWVSLDSCSKI